MNDTTGKLFIVATPIGNLQDIGRRAVDVLRQVDLVVAEDTRHSKVLLRSLDIDRPLQPYHDFSSDRTIGRILRQLQQGRSVALISDAGTPLVSDPGFRLVQRARQTAIEVLPVPGACAAIAALSVAGLPADRFVFEGFLPARATARRKHLQTLAREHRSLVFYESPHRILASLGDMRSAFGAARRAFVGRELTKLFETHLFASLHDCIARVEENPLHRKGEIVIVIEGCGEQELENRRQQQALAMVEMLEGELSLKRAVLIANQLTGAKKNPLYRAALNAAASTRRKP